MTQYSSVTSIVFNIASTAPQLMHNYFFRRLHNIFFYNAKYKYLVRFAYFPKNPLFELYIYIYIYVIRISL